MQTEIEKARLEFYKNHPEAIRRTLPARVVAICDRCLNEVDLSHPCLFNWSIHHTRDCAQYQKERSCPHCAAFHGRDTDGVVHTYRAIPHKRFRVVQHVLRERQILHKFPFFRTTTEILDSLIEMEQMP